MFHPTKPRQTWRPRREGQKISRYKSPTLASAHTRAPIKLGTNIQRIGTKITENYHRTITTGCSIEIYILSFHPERCHDATIHIISRDSSREKELVLSRTIENRFVFSVRAFYLKTKRKMQNDACRTNPLRNESSSRSEIRS